MAHAHAKAHTTASCGAPWAYINPTTSTRAPNPAPSSEMIHATIVTIFHIVLLLVFLRFVEGNFVRHILHLAIQIKRPFEERE